MSEINDFPAFPVDTGVNQYVGMSMRDYFAAKAMQGLLSESDNFNKLDEVPRLAYRIADGMLIVRAENE